MFQFIIALIVGIVSVSGGSLLWPRLTPNPRPQVLQQVHDIVIKTPLGSQAATVLGVTDETNVTPLNLGELVGSAAGEVKSAAEKRAQMVIMTQVTRELSKQYEKLPEDQKVQLQQIICQPPQTTP